MSDAAIRYVALDRDKIEVARRELGEVIRCLKQLGHTHWGRELEAHLMAMRGWYMTKESFFRVGTLCHPKALGDVHLGNHISSAEWDARLKELHDSCADAFNMLERLREEDKALV